MAKKATRKPVKKSTPKKKYRITVICNNIGGPVTAENVGLSFACPSCRTRLEVSKDYAKLEVGNENPPGHQLRSVKEIGRNVVALS